MDTEALMKVPWTEHTTNEETLKMADRKRNNGQL